MRKSYRKIKSDKLARKTRRKLSSRKKILGTSDCPRICVFRSNRNISVQVIDDTLGSTILSCSSFGKNVGLNAENCGKNLKSGKAIGTYIGEKMLSMGVKSGVYDRSGGLYAGVLKELADSIRSTGITI